jgi:5-methylcytosine-specific restriction endonuclease McrA
VSERTCSVPNCGRRVSAQGRCGAHHRRWLATGDVQAHIPVRVYNPGASCSVEGCDRPAQARSMCTSHARRSREGADLSAPLRRFNPGQTCEVETCDRLVDGRGLCSGHRQRLRLWGEVRPDLPLREWKFAPGGKCLHEECLLPTVANGLCKKHLGRQRRDRRRARLLGATVEAFDRLEVFDRDGWVCQICARPVDRSVQHPDPASVSLDHILPLSRGGEHSRVNCQTAHLICNLRKGARVDGDFGERASA